MNATVLRLTGSLVGAIMFLNYLPFAATYGVACIPMYAVVAVLFFLPVLVVTCDLTTRLPEGGIQCWVTEAFGRRFGLFAVYAQWLVALTFQPAALSYAATTAALAFEPGLAQRQSYVVVVTVTGAWLLALLCALGPRTSEWIVTACATLGMLLPLLIVIGYVGVREADLWLARGPPSISWPSVEAGIAEVQEIKYLTGMLFQFGGAELYAVSAHEYPRGAADYRAACWCAGLIVCSLYVAGSLVITLTAPTATTLLEVLPALGLAHLSPYLACLAAVGGFGMALAWALPPAMGLVRSLRRAQLLPGLHPTTASGVPLRLLVLQSGVITVLCGLFLLEDVGATFWVFTAVSAQLQLIMYITMFIAALRLLLQAPAPRATGTIAAAITGLLTCSCTLCFGFAPPKSVNLHVGWHATLMSLAVIVVSAAPLALPDRRRAMSVPKPYGTERTTSSPRAAAASIPLTPVQSV